MYIKGRGIRRGQKKGKNGMIKLFQIENENPLFDLWPLSNPKRASYYVDTETNRAVDNYELNALFGVSNFSTAKEYFEKYDEIHAKRERELEEDLKTEMRTTF